MSDKEIEKNETIITRQDFLNAQCYGENPLLFLLKQRGAPITGVFKLFPNDYEYSWTRVDLGDGSIKITWEKG